jgi:ectoine hydroxylase-related dioxygenase (phytanoyl-CoA dioxygenase family)
MKHEPEKWKADYERDGYLVVPDVLDAATLARLREEVEKITADPDTLPPELKRYVHMERDYVRESTQRKYNDLTAEQVGKAVRNIMELPLFSPFLGRIITYAPLLDILETLFESPEFHFHNYKCIIKAPKVSSAFRWHRDLPYLKHTTPNLITAMLCLDPMTKENGATVVLPGTHRITEDQFKKSDVEIQEDQLPRDAKHVTVECPAGSAVLFHVNIIHGGGPNRSEIPRRNVIGIWAGPDTYPTTAHRYAYGELYPRSKDPAKRLQVEKTFAGQ